MNHAYTDILCLTPALPLWWDEVGCPRYCPFHPSVANDIYAQEALLLLIKCQACGYEFRVCMAWDDRAWVLIVKGHEALPLDTPNLRSRVQTRQLSYGDPPNTGCCPAGATMTSEPVRVLEFWERKDLEWTRVPELEVDVS